MVGKRKVYKRYKPGRKGGQTYWKGKKGIANSISELHPTLTNSQAAYLVDTTFDGVTQNLKKEKRYAQPDFGIFKIKRKKARASRMGRNPFTGESVRIKAKPASNTIKFIPSKKLKRLLA